MVELRCAQLPAAVSSALRLQLWTQQHSPLTHLRMICCLLSLHQSYPAAVCSISRYQPQEEEARRQRTKWADERGSEIFKLPKRDWRGFSYGHLLSASASAPGRGKASHWMHRHCKAKHISPVTVPEPAFPLALYTLLLCHAAGAITS